MQEVSNKKNILNKILNDLAKTGFSLRSSEGKLRLINFYGGVLSDELREKISYHKDALIAELVAKRIPLTLMQKGLFYLYKNSPSAVYNVPFCVELPTKISNDFLYKVLVKVCSEFDLMSHIIFEDQDEVCFQKCLETSIPYLYQNIDTRDRAKAMLNVLSHQILELTKGKMFFIHCLAGDNFTIVFFNFHHIICDEMSVQIFLNRFYEYFENNLTCGGSETIKKLSFLDYAFWESDLLRVGYFSNQKTYWEKKFEGYWPEIILDESLGDVDWLNLSFSIEGDFSQKINEYCKKLAVSKNSFFLAVLKLIFFAYTKSVNVIISSIFSVRQHSTYDGIFGPLMGMLPIYFRFTEKDSIDHFVKSVYESICEALRNIQIPFYEIKNIAKDDYEHNSNLLEQIVYDYHEVNDDEEVSKTKRNFEIFYLNTSKFPFNFSLTVSGEKANVNLNFLAGSAFHQLSSAFESDYKKLLSFIVNNSNQPLSDIIDQLNFSKKISTIKLKKKISMQKNEVSSVGEGELFNKIAEIWSSVFKFKVNKNDDFFSIGGHSIIAMHIVGKVNKAFNLKLPIKILYLNPQISDFVGRVEEAISARITQVPIKKHSPVEKKQLSFQQMRLWFLEKFNDNVSSEYSIPLFFKILGKLSVDCLRQSVSLLVARHELLRVHIEEENGAPFFVDTNDHYFTYHERPNSIDSILKNFLEKPLNIASKKLFYSALCRGYNRDEYVLVINHHHIITDAWSINIILSDLSTIYQSLLVRQPQELPTIDSSYFEYSKKQQERFKSNTDKKLEYWIDALRGYENLNFPFDCSYKKSLNNTPESINIRLSEKLSKQIEMLAAECKVTPFVLMLTAYWFLLYKYTGQTNFVIGTLSAGRVDHNFDNVVGFFVNNLPLKLGLSSSLNFRSALRIAHEVFCDALDNEDVPYEKIIEAINVDRNQSISPIFQTMFVMQNIEEEKFELPQLTVEPIDFDKETLKFDLQIEVSLISGSYCIELQYNKSLLFPSTAKIFINHYKNLMHQLLAHPDCSLSKIQILDKSEQSFFLNDIHRKKRDYEFSRGYIEILEDNFRKHPDKIAAIFDEKHFTYRELYQISSSISKEILKLGKDSQYILLFQERSFYYLASLLAILRLGKIFVPMHPGYPEYKNQQIVDSFQSPVILFDEINFYKSVNINPQGINIDVSCVSLNYGSPPEIVSYALEDPCYLIFTSGTTGKPKGVIVNYLGFMNHLLAMIEELSIKDADNIAMTAPHVSDISIWQYLVCLITGGSVTILNGENAWVPDKLWQQIEKHGVTLLQLVPSHIGLILDYLSDREKISALTKLRFLISAGENLLVSYARKWFQFYSHIPLINAYGPAECADDVSLFWLETSEKLQGEYVPIGRAIANIKLYVLDSDLNLVPRNVVGELYVSGFGVGGGYHGLPRITKKKFIKNLFKKNLDKHHEILYRTGDLVRYNENYNLEFLSRQDHQVKIRGFRIELGEVENIVQGIPGIKHCCVLYDEKNSQLILFYVSDNGTKNEDIFSYLEKKLPDHMLPTLIHAVDLIPLSTNGKIDRKLLLSKVKSLKQKKGKVDNTTLENFNALNERRLFMLWQHILERNDFDANDSFFYIGGNSLLAARLILEINKHFGKKLPISWIFQNKTIFRQAKNLEAVNDCYYPYLTFGSKNFKKILVLVHPSGAGSEFYIDFAREFKDDVFVLSIENYNLYNIDQPKLLIQEQAKLYLDAIKAFHEKEIYLGGFSFGGLIAYEMACQFEKLGLNLKRLYLLDSYLFSKQDVAWLKENYHKAQKEIKKNPVSKAGCYEYTMNRLAEIELQQQYDYLPSKFEGLIDLFKASQPLMKEYDLRFGHLIEKMWNQFHEYPYNNWDAVSKNIRKLVFEGNHMTILENSNLIEKIREDLSGH